MHISRNLSDTLNAAFEGALPDGLPLFPGGVAASTPINAAPYLTDLAGFGAHFAFNDHRRGQLSGLEQHIARLRSFALHPHFLIAGGSYLDRDRPDPKDLDCALFYSSGPGADPSPPLRQILESAAAAGLDLRLMPFDAHPALAAKFIGFFTLLYASRTSPRAKRAIVIVDLGE